MFGNGVVISSIQIPSARKKRRLRRAVQEILQFWPRSVILAEDETDLLLFPPLRSCWAPRGKTALVRLCGRNARRVIFGVMNLRTGTRLFLSRQHAQAEDFQEFLDVIHDHYRGWHVVLLLDEDPSHTAEDSKSLADNYDIEMLWLPKRCPELNPVDTLWGQGKDRISANKQYATIDEQVDRFLEHLAGLSAIEALHTAGVLSDGFWLKRALMA
jgi:hypothetical protein